MSKQPWALILGATSGFGEAAAIELARAGMNVFGVHLDPPDKRPHAEEIRQKILALGRQAEFFNVNAADDEFRRDTVETIRQRLSGEALAGRQAASGGAAERPDSAAPSSGATPEPPGTLRVLLHSLCARLVQAAGRRRAGHPQKAARNYGRYHGPLPGLLGAGLPARRPV